VSNHNDLSQIASAYSVFPFTTITAGAFSVNSLNKMVDIEIPWLLSLALPSVLTFFLISVNEGGAF
jgi:hypothetical protein